MLCAYVGERSLSVVVADAGSRLRRCRRCDVILHSSVRSCGRSPSVALPCTSRLQTARQMLCCYISSFSSFLLFSAPRRRQRLVHRIRKCISQGLVCEDASMHIAATKCNADMSLIASNSAHRLSCRTVVSLCRCGRHIILAHCIRECVSEGNGAQRRIHAHRCDKLQSHR